MLRRARLLLRQGGSRRRTPASIQALPTPEIRRRWGALGELNTTEKEELLHGSWRQAKTVTLAPDETDRDRGGFAEGRVDFPSEEAAAQFLSQESAEDAAEHQIPALTLAQQFFADLAVTADEEMDLLQSRSDDPADGQSGRTRTAVERRQDESEDVQRHFFMDYYAEHGLLGPTDDRFAFVDATFTPAPAMVTVNCERPLVRLTVRHQLETHAMSHDAVSGPVFVPAADGDALTFALPCVPSQPYGAPLRLPYTAETSFLAQQEMATPQLAVKGSSTAMLSEVTSASHEADALANWLSEADVGVEGTRAAAYDHAASPADAPPAPPSFAHAQWLQRQVATDALVMGDIQGRVLTILSARWAYPAQRVGDDVAPSSTPPLILDLFGADTRQRGDVYRDIARYLYRAHLSQNGGSTSVSDGRRAALLLPCVAVCVHSARSAQSPPPLVRKSAIRSSPDEVPGRRDHAANALYEQIAVADQSPVILYVQSPAKGRTPSHATSPRRQPTVNAFEEACDVVLCTPVTSEDGRRARTILGDAVHSSEDTHVAAANAFIPVCTRARDAFPRLVHQLSLALRRYAKEGGVVFYATYSMNPIENEAVVAAAVHAVEGDALRVSCVPLRGDASPLIARCNAEERRVVEALLSHGQPGLVSWASVEGADPRHSAEHSSLSLRESIASAAWRLRPDRDPCDGGFVIALSVHRADHCTPRTEVVKSLPAFSTAFTGDSPLHATCRLVTREVTTETATVHVALSSCAWWWQAVRTARHSYWTDSVGGVVVGACDPSADRAGDSPPLELSSGINNSEYGYLVEQHLLNQADSGKPPLLAVTRIQVPAPLLCELLCRRSVSGRTLLTAASSDDSARSGEVRALVDALTLIMKSSGPHTSAPATGWKKVSVLLEPTLPSASTDATAHPHQAVLEELQLVRVAMSLRFRISRGQPHTAHSTSDFSLALSVPRGLPGRALHWQACAEATEGLRDALLFVLRRCGLSATHVLPKELEDVAETAPGTWADAPRAVELADDEFSVEDDGADQSSALLSSPERASRRRRLGALEKRLQSAGLSESAPTSWASSIHYGSARRSGRG